MTTPQAKFAGFVLIAALWAGFTLGLTAPDCRDTTPEDADGLQLHFSPEC